MRLRKLLVTLCMTVGSLALIIPTFAETTDHFGQGQAIVTVIPLKGNDASANITQDHLRAMVNGKETSITGWTPLRGQNGALELVILIDNSTSAEIGLKFEDVIGFIRGLPADAKVAVGYMDAGRAVLSGPLSSDHSRAVKELHIPAGVAGSNGSPYLCLSNLARHWPSEDASARREVILITDSVDNYSQRYDADDPYVKASINDSIRAGLVIYSIYMPNRGWSNSQYRNFTGQNFMADVTGATGGYAYWDGTGRIPVSFKPYFDDIAQRLQNQYRLRFQFRLKGQPELLSMNLEVVDHEAEVFAPRRVNATYTVTE